jgi:hypothetical protein
MTTSNKWSYMSLNNQVDKMHMPYQKQHLTQELNCLLNKWSQMPLMVNLHNTNHDVDQNKNALTFWTPGKISLIQSQSTVLLIATSCPDCVDSFGTKL